MSRTQSVANQAAADAPHVRPVMFVFLDILNDPARLHTGIGDIAFGGNTYMGVGDFGGVDVIEEQAELKSSTVQLKLSGVNPAFIDQALNSVYHARQAEIYLGFFEPDGSLTDDPDLWLDLLMDTMEISLDRESEIILNCENEMVYWNQPADLAYNDEDQQRLFPGDVGFEFLPQLQDARVVVGGRNVTENIPIRPPRVPGPGPGNIP